MFFTTRKRARKVEFDEHLNFTHSSKAGRVKIYCIIIYGFFIVFLSWFLFSGYAVSEDLTFPKTKEGFEQALSVKKNTEHKPRSGDPSRGLTRGLTRGIGGLAQPLPKPKAGALINFEYDSDRINQDSYPMLDTFTMTLKGGLTDAVIVVCGHTDNIGSDTYNQKLSIRRAMAVVDCLVYKHGIQKERLILKGFGETMPFADNGTELGRSINRRVEFVRNNY